MFSNRIANSARFLQMPAESQLLYFHFILRADDDGVVEAYPIMKLLGLAPDNFKVLIAKGFIKPLNEDQVIVITDWLEHNLIRADRKVDSIYKALLLEKCPEIPLIEPKPRSDVEDNSKRIGGLSTDGIGKVRLGKVRLGKVRLGKVRLGKVRLGKVRKEEIAEQSSAETPLNEMIDLFKAVNPSYERLFGNKTERAALARLIEKQGENKIRWVLNVLPKTNAIKYAPTITKPTELENKLGALIAFLQKEKTNFENKKIIKI